MKKINGSMTIEAAVILSLFFMLFLSAIQAGIAMYQEIETCAAEIMEKEEPDTVDDFYKHAMLEGLIENEN